MQVSSIRNHFVQFKQSLATVRTPLPKEGKIWEVAKRVAIVAAAPFVYLAMAIVYAIDYFSKTYKVAQRPENGGETTEEIRPNQPPPAGNDGVGAAPNQAPLPKTIATLEKILSIKNHKIITGTSHAISSGTLAAIDVLVKIEIDEEGEKFGRLHIKSQTITSELFQQQIESLFANLQTNHDAGHRSGKMRARWFVAGMNNEGKFARYWGLDSRTVRTPEGKIDKVEYTRGGGLGGFFPQAVASQFFSQNVSEAGFDAENLWALNRRDVQEDYQQLVNL